MRNALSLVVGVATLSLLVAACGDASTSSGNQRRPNPTLLGNGVDDGQATDGEDAVDKGNPNAGATPPPPTSAGTPGDAMALAVSTATPTVDLGGTTDVTVTITPKAGATGDADLTVTGLPAGASAAFVPAKVTLGTAPVTAKLTITVPVTATPTAPGGSAAVVVTAKVGTGTPATANMSFKTNPAAKLTIPLNIDALRSTGTLFLDQWGAAFGANPTPLQTQAGNGIVFTVYNADSKAHIVHGNNGFAHGSTTAGQEVQPNAFELQNAVPRTRTFLPGAAVNGYPHEGGAGPSAGFRFTVIAAP